MKSALFAAGVVALLSVDDVQADQFNYEIPITALGMDAQAALSLSDDANLSQYRDVCSNDHNQGDVANNWCHAALSNGLHDYLLEKGASKAVAHAAPIVLWFIKELVVDSKPSKQDVWGPAYMFRLGKKRENEFKVQCNLAGDCSVTWHREW